MTEQQSMDFAPGETSSAPHAPSPGHNPRTDEAGAEKDGAASGPPEETPESGAAPSSDFRHEQAVDLVQLARGAERRCGEVLRDPWIALHHWQSACCTWAEAVCLTLAWLSERPAARNRGLVILEAPP